MEGYSSPLDAATVKAAADLLTAAAADLFGASRRMSRYGLTLSEPKGDTILAASIIRQLCGLTRQAVEQEIVRMGVVDDDPRRHGAERPATPQARWNDQ